jgi:hypothetical protein
MGVHVAYPDSTQCSPELATSSDAKSVFYPQQLTRRFLGGLHASMESNPNATAINCHKDSKSAEHNVAQ